jgi:hypothetical protein
MSATGRGPSVRASAAPIAGLRTSMSVISPVALRMSKTGTASRRNALMW